MEQKPCNEEMALSHEPYDLDDIDRDILRHLQEYGRDSYRDIANKLKKSVSTVSKHIKNLEEHGVIKHYIAVVDCCKVGYKEMIMIFIKTDTSASIQDVLCSLESLPDINAVYQTTGSQPIFCIAKCLEKDDQIQLLEKIKRIKGISDFSTQVVLQRVKEDMRIKIPAA